MCITESAGERVQSSVLYQVFEAWCKSSGETAWKQKGFSMAMEERGYKRLHSNVTWFLDIKLVRYVHDFVDADGNPVKIGAGGKKEEARDVGDIEF
jgi:putative DNA primase/helicase